MHEEAGVAVRRVPPIDDSWRHQTTTFRAIVNGCLWKINWVIKGTGFKTNKRRRPMHWLSSTGKCAFRSSRGRENGSTEGGFAPHDELKPTGGMKVPLILRVYGCEAARASEAHMLVSSKVNCVWLFCFICFICFIFKISLCVIATVLS
jgi:hypothetical protein